MLGILGILEILCICTLSATIPWLDLSSLTLLREGETACHFSFDSSSGLVLLDMHESPFFWFAPTLCLRFSVVLCVLLIITSPLIAVQRAVAWVGSAWLG